MLFIGSDQPSTFITCETPGPYESKNFCVKQFPCLVRDNFKSSFLQKLLPVVKRRIKILFHRFIQLLIGPVMPILCIRDRYDLTNTIVLAPQRSVYFSVQLRYTVGQSGKAKSRQ